MVEANSQSSNQYNNSKFLKSLINFRLLFFFIFIIIIFGIIDRYYFSLNSGFTILMRVAAIGLVCIGQTMCLIIGGFDLSVGSIALASGVTAATLIRSFNINIWIVLIIIIIQGLLIGYINGIIINIGKISPLIVTLAINSIITGLCYFITKGVYINVTNPDFKVLGTYRLMGIKIFQLPIIIVFFIYIIFFIVLKYTSYGKSIYATGGNREAAKFSGLNIIWISESVYMLSGLLASISGFLIASRVGTAAPTAVDNLAITSVAAAVLGGTSLKGGQGSVISTLIAVFIVQSLNTGLLEKGIQSYIIYISSGLVLLAAVFFDIFFKET